MDESVKRWSKALAQRPVNTLRAEMTIVTPMFIGDGVQRADSVRPPSIKGALRYWWRALNWGRLLAAEGGGVESALKRLHRDEARLFGLAAKNDQGGQGLFLLSVEQPEKLEVQSGWPRGGNSQGGYLGYGLLAANREFLAEGQAFTLTLAFKSAAKEEDHAQMRQAVSLWGLLGGLGSRARRGFGSVALDSLDGEPMSVSDSDQYAARLKAALGEGPWPATLAETPFTAWSQQVRCLAFAPKPSGRQAIAGLEAPYKDVRKELKGKQKAVFGLPLKNHDDTNRRASPFIMHVHPVGERYLPVVTYLPAHFHYSYPGSTLEDTQSARPLEMFFEHSKERLL